MGWPILMPDMRAHGKSEGNISFGIRERHDVRTWLEYLEQRFEKKRISFLPEFPWAELPFF